MNVICQVQVNLKCIQISHITVNGKSYLVTPGGIHPVVFHMNAPGDRTTEENEACRRGVSEIAWCYENMCRGWVELSSVNEYPSG